MRGRRVAITGASGYLGTGLARRCLQQGAEVLGLDVREPGDRWPDGAVHRHQDVTQPGLEDQLEEFGARVLVHLAWIFDPVRREGLERRVDVGGTVRTFRAAMAAGVERIVYASSTTSYGIRPHRTRPFVEADPPDPNPGYPYAYYKALVERWLPGFRARAPEIDLVVLRPCIVIGPRTRNVVTRLTELPVMPRVSGYDPPVQLVHEGDALAALVWGVGEAPDGAFNVTGKGVMRYSEICKAAGRIPLVLPASFLYPAAALAWRARLLPFPPGLLDYIRYPWVADNRRIVEAGLPPRHTTREAFGAYLEAR